MKKIITFVMSVMMILSFAACGEKNTVPEEADWDYCPTVMVDGVLYFDTGIESDEARCGVMDGKIDSKCPQTELPAKNNQSNFAKDIGYQYGEEGTVNLLFENGIWRTFATEEKKDELLSVGISNPIRESSQDEFESYGVIINIPENAEDVSCQRIVGDRVIYQVEFTCEGDAYTIRTMVTDSREDISGMYYEWGEPEGGEVPEDKPMCMTNESGQGVIIWYADGRSCSIAMTENADGSKLIDMYKTVTGE